MSQVRESSKEMLGNVKSDAYSQYMYKSIFRVFRNNFMSRCIYIYIYFVVDYFSTFPKLKYNTNNTHTHSCRFCWISLERGQRIDWFMGPNWGAGPEFEPGYRWQSKVVAFVIHGKVHRQRHLLGACCNMDFHSWRILPPCPLAASAQLR